MQNAEGKLYTDHKIGNPFDNFAQTCANCHTQDKAALQKVVAERKQSINDLKIKVEDQLVHAHFEAKAALDAGATEAEMKADSGRYPSCPVALGSGDRFPRHSYARTGRRSEDARYGDG